MITDLFFIGSAIQILKMITALLKDTPTKERGEGPVFFPVEVKLSKNFNGFVVLLS